MKLSTLALVLSFCSTSALATDPGVREAQYTALGNAASICFPARPVYDANVRKRPLAIVNEGTGPSFISCAFTSNEYANDLDGDGAKAVERFSAMAHNQSNAPMTISCVAVIGVDDGGAHYITKSVELASGERRSIEWNQSDNGGHNYGQPVGLSCLLPVLGALNEVRIHWDYNDLTQ